MFTQIEFKKMLKFSSLKLFQEYFISTLYELNLTTLILRKGKTYFQLKEPINLIYSKWTCLKFIWTEYKFKLAQLLHKTG